MMGFLVAWYLIMVSSGIVLLAAIALAVVLTVQVSRMRRHPVEEDEELKSWLFSQDSSQQ